MSSTTYQRQEDGLTYWIDGAGNFMAASTYTNGAVDYDNAVHVSEFDEPLDAAIVAHITALLRGEQVAEQEPLSSTYWDEGDGVTRRRSDDSIVGGA